MFGVLFRFLGIDAIGRAIYVRIIKNWPAIKEIVTEGSFVADVVDLLTPDQIEIETVDQGESKPVEEILKGNCDCKVKGNPYLDKSMQEVKK